MSDEILELINSLLLIILLFVVYGFIIVFRGFAVPERIRGISYLGLLLRIEIVLGFVVSVEVLLNFVVFSISKIEVFKELDIDEITISVFPLIFSLMLCASIILITSSHLSIELLKNNKEYKIGNKQLLKINKLSQLFFYMLSILICALSILNSEENIFTTVCSFSLLFIIDDFLIISDYREQFQEYANDFHYYRIIIANVVLILCTMIILKILYSNIMIIFIFFMIQTIFLFFSSYKALFKVSTFN